MQLKTMNAYSDKVTTDNYVKQVIKLPVTKVRRTRLDVYGKSY